MGNRNVKYVINIKVMFVLGVILFLWGLSRAYAGKINANNLDNTYYQNVELDKIGKGNYISCDSVSLFGTKIDGRLCPISEGYLSPNEYDFYVVKINPDMDEYICLRISTRNIDKFFDSIDENLNSDYKLRLKVSEISSISKSLILTCKNEGNININTKYELVQVNFESEKSVLSEGVCLILTGVILVLLSMPWKMIEKRYVLPEKEIKFSYGDEIKKSDIFFAEDMARNLRKSIWYLNDEYQLIKSQVKKYAISFIISALFTIMNDYYVVFKILTFIYFSLFIYQVFKLWINGNSDFARKIANILNKRPLKEQVIIEQNKLATCEKFLDLNLNNNNEIGEY